MNILHRALPAVLLVSATVATASAQPPIRNPKPATLTFKRAKEIDRSKLETQFAKKMSGAALVGSFTVDGKSGTTPRTERYELGEVKKLKADQWLFTAKWKYGSKEQKIAIPLTLTIQWAGDTPVITMTDYRILGLGTFTARVLFYKDRYVGTWQHGKVGGHMFGKIEPAKTGPKRQQGQ